MAQPILISQGTILDREKSAQNLINQTFLSNSDYLNNIDFKLYELLEDKKLISIEQARDLIHEINIKPRIYPKKVIWIKEAQSLSTEAQNALLKTLEEPPEYSQIILTVDHASNLIPTVISRCIIKDLNLSSRVDLSSDDFNERKKELLGLLDLDIGKKIDWVTENKSEIKDRDVTIELLNFWEAALREKMLEVINTNEAVAYKEKIQLIQKIKKYISANANIALSIEALLINL